MTNQTPTDYILFLAQEANFQTRSMLVPAIEFLEVRGEDYKTLQKASKSCKFVDKDKDYFVDNLIVLNYSQESKNCWTQDQTEYSKICGNLAHYADWGDEMGITKENDNKWLDKSIFNLCDGFNHIKNYANCMKKKKVRGKNINIIDGFLILESMNGKLKLSQFDTVDDMMEATYGYRPSEVKKLLDNLDDFDN